MRRCDTVEEVGINYDLVKAEAKKAFGNDDIFMEKFLVEPKPIGVQGILFRSRVRQLASSDQVSSSRATARTTSEIR